MLKRALTLDHINIMQLQLQQLLKEQQQKQQHLRDSRLDKNSSRQADQDSVTSDSSVCQVMFSCEPVITVSCFGNSHSILSNQVLFPSIHADALFSGFVKFFFSSIFQILFQNQVTFSICSAFCYLFLS